MLFVIFAIFLLISAGTVRGRSIDSPQMPNGFTVHKVIRTWEEADLQCKSEGAVLASPITSSLLNEMRSLISDDNTTYFIGTKSSGYSGSFVSVEGISLDMMTEAVVEMVQQLDPYDGNCLTMDQHRIHVVPCCVRRPFFCYKASADNRNSSMAEPAQHNNEGPSTIMTTLMNKTTISPQMNVSFTGRPRKGCPEGYTYYESTGNCYKVHRELKIWDDAQATCVAEGATLAVIDDRNEAQTIINMGITTEYPNTFVGLRDFAHNNVWTSVTGKSRSDLYNVWAFGNPSDANDGLYCAVIRRSGNLDNYSCNVEREFVCEY